MKKSLLFFMLLFAPMLMAQTVHKVTLRWNASASTTVTHYGVYRATVSGGPYAYLGYTTGLSYANSKNPDGTPLADNAVFYYVVVAFTAPDPVTKKSSHSVNSNEVQVTIPVTVVINAPTGLTSEVE